MRIWSVLTDGKAWSLLASQLLFLDRSTSGRPSEEDPRRDAALKRFIEANQRAVAYLLFGHAAGIGLALSYLGAAGNQEAAAAAAAVAVSGPLLWFSIGLASMFGVAWLPAVSARMTVHAFDKMAKGDRDGARVLRAWRDLLFLASRVLLLVAICSFGAALVMVNVGVRSLADRGSSTASAPDAGVMPNAAPSIGDSGQERDDQI